MLQTSRGFRPDQSAHAVHQALKSSLMALEKAQQCAVLWFGEVLDRQLYRELGYSSINQYAKLELGFSTSRTGDFLQLCRKLKNLPKVRAKVESGELGYTAVQPSLIPVPHQRPAAVVPVRVNLEMTPTQFARYEKLWEQVRKRTNAPDDKVEAMLEMMANFVAESSPRGDISAPPVQLHIHKCSECAKPSVATSKGELEIGQAELERAECDCRVSRPNERNSTSIPPATRRRVLAHHRHKCQRPGCGHTQYLEVHHMVPRSRGGSNDSDNLTCLCAGCHSLIHDRKGFMARSPEAVYHWRLYNRSGAGIN